MPPKRIPKDAVQSVDYDTHVLNNGRVPRIVSASKIPNGQQDSWAAGTYSGHGYGVILDNDPTRAIPGRNMSDVLAEIPQPAVLPKEHFYNIKAVLDQGPEHTDVGYAIRHWLTSAPLQSFLGPTALTIHEEARRVAAIDERRRGTTLRSGMEVLKRRGHIDEYFYFTNAEDVRLWLLGHGAPIVMASIWTGGMAEPTHGFLTVSGPIIDRHAYVLMGWSDLHNAARILNSHGKDWCDRGRGWLRAHMIDFLLKDGGHAYSSPSKYIGVDASDNVAQRYLDDTNQTGSKRPSRNTPLSTALEAGPSLREQLDIARAAMDKATQRRVIRHAVPVEDTDNEQEDTNDAG